MILKKAALTAVLTSALVLSAAASFDKTQEYSDNLFTDVPNGEWYHSEVKNTYELGLMNGIGQGLFNPDGNVTVAEAITMASRAAAAYSGETIPASAGEWYQMYVDYGVSHGFVSAGQFDDYDRPAKRYEVAQIFENAMPDGYFTAKNNVSSIPDVSSAKPYHDDLITLYRAGVVMGSDSYGNFKPEDNITRAEAAAIINRVALPENRLSKTLDVLSDDDAYMLNITTGLSAGGTSGIKSGWLYDNRGGQLTSDYKINLDTIVDDSEDDGIALIREFNKTETGRIVFESQIDAVIPDGIYYELQNDKGQSIYRVEIKDGSWQLLNADGTYTVLCTAGEGVHTIRTELDIDNAYALTSINANASVLSSLLVNKADVNLYNMRFATTDKEKPKFKLVSSYAYANYGVWDNFAFTADGNVPFGYTASNASVVNGELCVENGGTASKIFSPVSGEVIYETLAFVNSKTNTEIKLMSGSKTIASLKADGKSFSLNGQSLYDYYDGLWYKLRLELDTDSSQILFKLNGREIATVPFAEASTSIDGIAFIGNSDETAKFDDVKLWRNLTHDDYVPVPVKPAGEEKYNVGMNVCPLWVEGTHSGWKCITPYERTVLGYYDEGNPETADWEIKYMLEHGIDFQAFCWYSDVRDSYVKTPTLSSHLHDGYMNAEYSDMMDFALLLECNSAVGSLDGWKKYHVPYLIEYYFKDPRYMKIGNEAVVCTYALGSWTSSKNFGSVEALKEALDYLEQEVIKLGYDGIIYVSSQTNLDGETIDSLGLDGLYYYNFGTNGARLDMNKLLNTWQNSQQETYVVPTLSVGFNNVAWAGTRSSLLTTSDMKELAQWTVDEYFPNYAEKDSWQDGFVMLSNWNEYGEGTYIMPSENNGGFGYLDALRSAYTDEEPDESLNTIPTENQLRRINRMYPQYRQDLKNSHTADLTAKKKVIASVDCVEQQDDVKLAWLGNARITENGLTANVTGNDPRFKFENIGSVPADEVKTVRVQLKVPEGTIVEMYYRTDSDETYGQDKWLTARAATDELGNVDFSVKGLEKWTGNITGIFIDPIRSVPEEDYGVEVSIKKLELLSDKDEGVTKTITINGLEQTANMQPEFASNFDLLMPFDMDFALEYKLNLFVTWDKATQTMKLEGKNNTLEFTVGSEICVIDGEKVTLPYTIETLNGYPLVPIKLICETLGYTYSFNEETGIKIDIPGYEGLYDNVRPLNWDFDIAGYLGGWSSYNSTLAVSDGLLKVETSSNDPVLQTTLKEPVPAENYSKVEIKVRFDGKSPKDRIQIFFQTDKESGWSEARAYNFYPDLETTDGEWWTGSFDLISNEKWTSNITAVRFDPFNSSGVVEVDYIRFYEKTQEEVEADRVKLAELQKEREEQKAITDQQDDGKSLIWSFNTVGDVEGWTSYNAELSADSGEYLEFQTSSKDPVMLHKVEINAEDYTSFKIRATIDLEPPATQFEMFWTTEDDPTLDQDKRLVIKQTNITTLGEYWIGEYDLTKHPLWKGKITLIRIDPFNSPGHMNIDYIRLQGR